MLVLLLLPLFYHNHIFSLVLLVLNFKIHLICIFCFAKKNCAFSTMGYCNGVHHLSSVIGKKQLTLFLSFGKKNPSLIYPHIFYVQNDRNMLTKCFYALISPFFSQTPFYLFTSIFFVSFSTRSSTICNLIVCSTANTIANCKRNCLSSLYINARISYPLMRQMHEHTHTHTANS